MKKFFYSLLLTLAALPAAAQEKLHMAEPWQLNLQHPNSPIMGKLTDLHDFLLIIIFAVSLFVLALMVYICLKFNRKANPVPSTTSHNTRLEIIWTTIPILILIAIAVPSVRTHYFIDVEPEAEMTVKVTGNQWYWHYDYPDHGNFGFDSYMLPDEEAKAKGAPRLLEVDNRMVVPVDTVVRVQLTAADVIHAWAVPALGVKRDAVPGRLNESWFKVEEEGVYYGQCSELCGKLHGFMPVAMEVVSKEAFNSWVAAKQKEAGIDPASLIPASDAVAPKPPTEQTPTDKNAAVPAGGDPNPAGPKGLGNTADDTNDVITE